MTLIPVEKIGPPEWMIESKTQKLMEVIGGRERHSLFVGGCVRNQLLNKAVEDIDIATQLSPQDVIKKLKAVDIKAIPTGIDHGTVTAVVEGKPFEITTLRNDVVTDGRHAEVAFTEDWFEDAKRRDFTMNTLLADIEGNIYDPTGQGLENLKERRVVFVGDPAARIAEDYLRILRFFRFHAFYGEGDMDQEALRACQNAAHHVKTLSRERITSEFLKILSAEKAIQILQVMFDCNVLMELRDKNYQDAMLRKLCVLQFENNTVELMARLFILGGNKARFYEDILRLTHAQKNFLVKLEMAFNLALYVDEKALKKAIFYNGNALLVQGYLLLVAADKIKRDDSLLHILQNWQAPKCPITGDMLIAEGYVTGPDLGIELARRQEEWLEDHLS
ncbi:MAG: CCA tRNA nucleotidyltransferase [Alphaproteobacteria bacterium]|nr:CCA tRNA nucleotidyltransferase [Alphaproteobacteria bacterium]